jgi:hypothetical protein
MKLGSDAIKECIQTYPGNDEMCTEDDEGHRCYNIFQNVNNSRRIKFIGTNISRTEEISIRSNIPNWCG